MLTPDVIDRHGPAFKREKVERAAAMLIARGDGMQRRVRKVTNDLDKASEITEEATRRFSERLDALMKKEGAFVEASKKASGSVRDATQKLADGLAKLERTANFDRLERMTELLERAEKALTSLAELDKAGKLERIAAVFK